MTYMNYKRVLSAVAVFTFLSTNAFAAKYKVDQAHSNVDFTIRHLVSKVNGSFKDYTGEFDFDEAKGDMLKDIKFNIKTASVDTRNEKRDEHLRSPDFFDSQKYPSITFDGKKVTKTGKNKFKVVGDITMHGVTKPATFDVEYLGTAKNMMGETTAGFTATAKLDRKDFGIIWNKAMDKGGAVLGDEVTVNLNVEAVKEGSKEEAKK